MLAATSVFWVTTVNTQLKVVRQVLPDSISYLVLPLCQPTWSVCFQICLKLGLYQSSPPQIGQSDEVNFGLVAIFKSQFSCLPRMRRLRGATSSTKFNSFVGIHAIYTSPYQRLSQIPKRFLDNGGPTGQDLSSPVDRCSQEGELQKLTQKSFIQGQ